MAFLSMLKFLVHLLGRGRLQAAGLESFSTVLEIVGELCTAVGLAHVTKIG